MEITRAIPDADIEIYGEGSIGDKAGQLAKKTPALRKMGFYTPRRVVLAEGFFDGFFQQNGLGQNLRTMSGDEAVIDRVLNGSFSQEESEIITGIIRPNSRVPRMVRSSGAGDARGTGIYRSEVTENNPTGIETAVRKVLASYFTESAIAFRRDARLTEGFGVMIEPMVGQPFDSKYDPETYRFAPLISGYGYTSILRGAGYINVVPGIGGGVDSKDGEKINREALEEYNGSLREYCFARSYTLDFRGGGIKDSALLDPNHRGKMYSEGKNPGYTDSIIPTEFSYYEPRIGRMLSDINITSLFDMSDRMEQVFGAPQYFEWAMTFEGQTAKYWILQIADVDKEIDLVEFGDYGEVMFTGHTVRGSGIRECTKVVNLRYSAKIESLRAFNQRNSNYVLIYPSSLTTKLRFVRSGRGLEYADYNNASVFLEIENSQHGQGGPVAHLDGRLDLAGKLVGALDQEANPKPNWKKFREGSVEEDGLEVYQGRIKVVASERRDKMVVYVD